jgi:hypothetical protein
MTDRRRRPARAAAVALFCLCWGLTAVIVVIAIAKHQLASLDSGGSLQAAQSWAPAIVVFGLAFLVYPDGGALTSRWRWVIRAYVVLGGAWIAGAWALAVLAAARHDIQVDAGGNLTTGQNAPWFSVLSEVFFLGTGVAWLAWLGYQVVAWRRSAGERCRSASASAS